VGLRKTRVPVGGVDLQETRVLQAEVLLLLRVGLHKTRVVPDYGEAYNDSGFMNFQRVLSNGIKTAVMIVWKK